MQIRGKLVDQQNHSFTGHQVVVSLWQQVPLEEGVKAVDGRPAGEQVLVPAEARTEVQAGGAFAVELPHGQIRDPVVLRVLAPDGQVLADSEHSLSSLKESLSWAVEAKVPLPLAKSPDRFLGQRVKLMGRVLEALGRQQIAGRQVVLWARPRGSDDGFAPVLAAQTDRQGYFSGEYPRGLYEEAYGAVAVGSANQKVPIPLDAGTFPLQVLLVVEAPDDGEDHTGAQKPHDCACKTEVPRAPDFAELTSASATYSVDFMPGECVSFTAPNRTLEEFNFHTLVRTTEPGIQGISLKEPQEIPPLYLSRFVGAKEETAPESAMLLDEESVTEGQEAVALTRTTDRPPTVATVTPSPAAAADRSPAPTTTQRTGTTTPERPTIARARGTIDATVLARLARDPDDLSPQVLLQAERTTSFRELHRFLHTLKKKVPARAALSADNPVDWDDTPTFYQATTIAHGHVLHFKQVWKADGYSLGDLLYSLPLAPGQKKQIVVLDWERREIASRTESLTEEEQLTASLSRDRDINEVVRSTLRESQRGGSESSTWGLAAGTGGAASFSLGGFLDAGAVFGMSGGAGSASSSAWQKSSRKLAASSLQQLRDRTMQSAAALRSQRATVVQSVRQGETLRVESEVVANHNHCHAVTMEYFEVLRHFQVLQELVDVQECLFVPLLMSPFDDTKALRWREPLRRHLRDRRLVRGFDAMERIRDKYEGSDLPLGSYAQETLQSMDGELRIAFHLTRPADTDKDELDPASWSLYEPFLTLFGGSSAVFNLFFDGRPRAERDQVFQQEVAPRIAEAFVQGLLFRIVGGLGTSFGVPFDATLVSRYAPGVPLTVSLRLKGPVTPVTREFVQAFEIAAIHPLPAHSRTVVHSGTVRYRTKYMSHPLFRDSRIVNDLKPGDPVRIPTFLSPQELRRPREEDLELRKKLLAHLNEHLEHYHQAIWWHMDPQRRFMLLDGFIAPNSGGRSVASVVENRLLGIVGNSLVMPVARGYHLDPTFGQDQEDPIDLLEHYAPTTPIPPMRLSMATNGIYMESVMGSCNACEVKDETRFWRFDESPLGDEPTAIQPIGTDTRRADPGSLAPTPLPAPIVNFQTAPPAPDPTGLASALAVLGTPNLFRDVTGLELTQKNALAALQTAMEGAKFFGGEAAKLASQRAATQDTGRILDTINREEKRGGISQEDAADLRKKALSRMVGAGGDSGGASASDAKPPAADQIMKAVQEAAAGSGGGGGQAEFTSSAPFQTVSAKVSYPESSVEESTSGEQVAGYFWDANEEDDPFEPSSRGLIPFGSEPASLLTGPLGTHQYGGGTDEGNGIVYTCKAGFLDLSRLRDAADLTRYLAAQALRLLEKGKSLMLVERDTYSLAGILRRIKFHKLGSEPDPELCIRLGQHIAYELAVWDEIERWFDHIPNTGLSDQHCSFAPPNLYSSILGCTMAGEALRREGSYEDEMTKYIALAMSLNEMRTAKQTENAFGLVDGLWWDSSVETPRGTLVKRRHLDAFPVVEPWVAPGEVDGCHIENPFKARIAVSDLWFKKGPPPSSHYSLTIWASGPGQFNVNPVPQQVWHDPQTPFVFAEDLPKAVEVVRQEVKALFGPDADKP